MGRYVWTAAGAVALVPVIALAGAMAQSEVGSRRSSLVQREPVDPPTVEDIDLSERAAAVFPLQFRTINGVGNNPMNPTWGAAGVMLLRKAPNAYADASLMPARPACLSAREISNLVVAQPGDLPNETYASDYLWQWGQFLDHDIDETPVGSPAEEFDIKVPTGDLWFDPSSTGSAWISFDRSAGQMDLAVRQQINNITAYIDASNVYGSDETRASALRTLDGDGRLKTSDGDLLPFNTGGLPNAPTSVDPSFFLAGDIRANEQVGLTAIHTLFVREHNFWADWFRTNEPTLSGDEVYLRARAIVGAEMQAITYREFLPLLLGLDALPAYVGYDPSVNAGIANEFATAGYRVGHTMLSPTIRRLDSEMATIGAGDLPLASAFFTPAETLDQGIDPVLRGLSSQRAQEIDAHIVDAVRNFLFGPPGAGGFDLASLNIQRGRDHGLPSYNDLRVCYGLAPVTSMAEITADAILQSKLGAAYASVDDIDPWVGLLSEDHAPGAMVGETLKRLLVDQFTRLRDGDRFWYEAYLPPDWAQLVDSQRLSTIIRRNTDIGYELRDNVFRMDVPCIADMDGDSGVGPTDLAALLAAYGQGAGRADLNFDGFVDGPDLALLLAQWGPCD